MRCRVSCNRLHQQTGATISPVNTQNATILAMGRDSSLSQPPWWKTSRLSGVSTTWGGLCAHGWRLRRRREEVRYDTDDASAREISAILVPESTLCTVQSPWHRQYRASLLDRQGQAHRTVALHPVPPRVLRAGGHLDGAEQAARSDRGTVAEMSAVGCL